MRRLALAIALGLGLASVATAAAAVQDPGVSTGSGELRNPSAWGRDATTPSRIAASRVEMNRGRNLAAPASPPEAELRVQATSALGRAGYFCTPIEVVAVGHARSGRPLIEVDCVEGGGMIVADDDPPLAVDCLDVAPATSAPGRGRRVVEGCRLPANVAATAVGAGPDGSA